eukprot:2656668-Rhodomonas_salina.3
MSVLHGQLAGCCPSVSVLLGQLAGCSVSAECVCATRAASWLLSERVFKLSLSGDSVYYRRMRKEQPGPPRNRRNDHRMRPIPIVT